MRRFERPSSTTTSDLVHMHVRWGRDMPTRRQESSSKASQRTKMQRRELCVDHVAVLGEN